MKKFITILAGAALFAACEQKTETVNTPAGSPAASKTEHNTTIVNPTPAGATKSETNTTNTTNMSTTSSPSSGTSTETSTSTTTASASPSGR